MNRRKCKIYK